MEVKIIEHRHWTTARVRKACINNHLYTCGTNEEYGKMLEMVSKLEPTAENIYLVGKNIKEHSEGMDIEDIMFILAGYVITTFEVKEQ